MDKRSTTLRFLQEAQSDPKLGARVLLAVERGGRVTADEVMQIAREFGYTFTRAEFEREARRNFKERFSAGEQIVGEMAAKKKKPKPKPPQSSCAQGCLSYTVSWHPVIE
jgi:hypothetical protein